MRMIQGAPILCSMFLMDLNDKTQELTAKATLDTKLVTIRSLVSIMGLLQSPVFLNLFLENLTTEIKDIILQYFLKYVHYLDNLQTGVVAGKVLELQRQVDLDAVDLNIKCDDDDCRSHEDDDRPVINEDLLGGATPPDEKRCMRHLLRGKFGKKLLHKLCLRAATLEDALIYASMPSKGVTTSKYGTRTRFCQQWMCTLTPDLHADQGLICTQIRG